MLRSNTLISSSIIPLKYLNFLSSSSLLQSSRIFRRRSHSLLSSTLHPDPSTMNIRVRFAPSPTGSLHLGGARTALFNYLFAKKYNGSFIIRIEDTDEARSTKESEISILNDLKWLGLMWDEGPDVETCSAKDCGPYRQSERKQIYMKCAEQLIKDGVAYRCFYTENELELMKNQSISETGHVSHFQSKWRNATEEEIAGMLEKKVPYTIRFKTPNKKLYIDDIVRGHVSWDAQANIGDFIIMRSNGVPVYNFCVAVDDVLMNISHVIRAEEHLSNTLRQLLIIEGLKGKPPIYAHCSLILGSDRSKLSKRHGAASLTEFKNEGYLPSAMVNYLATLGWNDGTSQEIYTVDELSKNFNLFRLVPSSAMFDKQKLQWVNKQHLRRMPRDWLIQEVEKIITSPPVNSEITEVIDSSKIPSLSPKHSLRLKSLLCDLFLDSSQNLLTPHSVFEEIQSLCDYPLFETIEKDKKAEKLINELEFQQIASRIISDWKNGKFPQLYNEKNYHPNESPLTSSSPNPNVFLHNANWEHYLISVANELSIPVKKVYHPFRLALTGKMKGPDVGGLLEILHLMDPLVDHKNEKFKMVILSQRMKLLEQCLENLKKVQQGSEVG